MKSKLIISDVFFVFYIIRFTCFRLPVKVPTGCALFPHELLAQPKSILASKYNIIQYNYMPRGGHFAAFEEPRLLADDVFSFVKKTEEMTKESQQKK